MRFITRARTIVNYLHVIMHMRSDPSKQVVVYDLTEEVLKELFLPKFNARAPFAWESLTISPADVTDVWIRKTTDTVYALLRRRQMESPFGDYTLLKVAEEGKDITGDYEIHI